jgi:hypothetical protein
MQIGESFLQKIEWNSWVNTMWLTAGTFRDPSGQQVSRNGEETPLMIVRQRPGVALDATIAKGFRSPPHCD